MSGAQTSTGTDPNILLRTLSGQQTADVTAQQIANTQNQLMNPIRLQQAQQQVGDAEMDVMGRAALGLLSLPDEAARAAAYPGVVADLQRMNFAKNAPAQYPGEAALHGLVSRAVPVGQQYQYGMAIPPGLAAALSGGSTPPASPGGGPDPITGMPVEQALPAIEQRESGGRNIATQIKNPDGTPASTASGYYQMLDTTFQDGLKLAGIPGTWKRAMDAPREVQTAVANAIFRRDGAAPWAASNPNRNRGTQTASTTPPGAPPAAAPTAPAIQQGGPPPAPPGGAPGAAASPSVSLGDAMRTPNPSQPQFSVAPPAPGQRADVGAMVQGVQQAQASPLVRGTGLEAGPSSAVATVAAPSAPWSATGGATTYSDSPTVAPNQLAPKPPPAAPAPAAPPQQQAQAPAAPMQIPGTGVNSPQYQRFQAIQNQISQLMPYAALPAAKAKIAQLQAEQSVLMQMDSVVMLPDGRQVHTLTGKVDLPNPPRFHEGGAIWDNGQWRRPVPGEQGVAGAWAVGPNGEEFFPAASQPATASYDRQKELWTQDRELQPRLAERNATAATNQIRINEMRKLLDQVDTGALGPERVDWANLADTLGWHDLAKSLAGKGGAAAAQEFAKYGLQTAGAAERGDLGARGSLGAISLYQKNNPGLELQPDANRKMLAMQLIGAQADRDYTEQAMDHFKNNNEGFLFHNAPYSGINNFETQWAKARNPQIYAAAMEAISGSPWERWTSGLNLKSPDDVQRVIDIVRRADPTSSIQWKDKQQLPVNSNG